MLTKEDYRRISELLTEMRWMNACFTSFLPAAGKERKPFEKKLHELNRLRELCWKEAMMAEDPEWEAYKAEQEEME